MEQSANFAFDIWELCGHGSNLIYLFIFFVKDIQKMRLLFIVATATELLYFYNAGASPLWAGVFWCAAYVVVNSFNFLRARWMNARNERSIPALEG